MVSLADQRVVGQDTDNHNIVGCDVSGQMALGKTRQGQLTALVVVLS